MVAVDVMVVIEAVLVDTNPTVEIGGEDECGAVVESASPLSVVQPTNSRMAAQAMSCRKPGPPLRPRPIVADTWQTCSHDCCSYRTRGNPVHTYPRQPIQS